jgi:hypothetical protein
MSFYTRYDLTGMLHDGPVKTFSAHQTGTGRTVGVHLFTAKTAETMSLLEQVRNLGDPVRNSGNRRA